MQNIRLKFEKQFDPVFSDWLDALDTTRVDTERSGSEENFSVSFTRFSPDPDAVPALTFRGTGDVDDDALPAPGAEITAFGYSDGDGRVFEVDGVSLERGDVRNLFRTLEDGTTDGEARREAFQDFLDDNFVVKLRGSPLPDGFAGTPGPDTLYGNRDNDTLNGRDGNDQIIGQAGADLMSGLKGADTVEGRRGPDTAAGNAGDDIVRGQQGTDVLYGGAGDDFLLGDRHDDTLRGQGNDDSLVGGHGNDVIFGGRGDDTITPRSITSEGEDTGRDFIKAGPGNDRVETRDGADRVFLGNGDDELLSFFGGRDTITGGNGEDVFRFGYPPDSGKRKIVTDFTVGEDRIDPVTAERFDNLEIVDQPRGALVTWGDFSGVKLLGVAAADLGPDDFIF